MTTLDEINQIILLGESSRVQFKESVTDAYKLGTEMVAFSNSLGGKLIIGVNDKTGLIKGFSFEEIQFANNLLANAASENVKPPIIITTESILIDSRPILVVSIPEGKDKPYKDNKGIIWVKNGSDKRKVFSNDELRVLMQSSGNLAADHDSVIGTSIADISIPALKQFLFEKYASEFSSTDIKIHQLTDTDVQTLVKTIDPNFTLEQLLRNISMMDQNGHLTLAGLLLLAKSIQRYKPVFTIKCVSFVGNSLAGTDFRDKMPDRELEGNLLHQYQMVIAFIHRNLRSVQVAPDFNSNPRLEIPPDVFVELLVNALIHRDYYQQAPIRLLIFDNRIEICSPGNLPYSVTEELIKQGISKPRNHLLFSNANFLLPYTGIGSGILRATRSYDKITFDNSIEKEEFKVIIWRDENFGNDDGNYDSNDDGNQEGVYDSVHDGVYDQKIFLFCLEPKSRTQILVHLGLSIQTKNWNTHLKPLITKGFIVMTRPDKRRSKKQEYLTTETGKKQLNMKRGL